MSKHRFACLAFGNLRISRWHCRNCGLTVGGRAAKQLEGLPCR